MSRSEQILEGLIQATESKRLPHALIFGGAESGAKVDCVERFAAAVFARASGGDLFGESEDPAAILERVKKRSHPDFHFVEPANDIISVDEVRDLPKILAFPPLESEKRVVLINGSGKMNVQAANAILKVLEEPPPHTMFFLLCRDPAELLPTIVSRCQVIRFAPLAESEISGMLRDEEGVADPELLTSFAEGSFERVQLLRGIQEGERICREAGDCLLSLWEASPKVPSKAFKWIEVLDGEESVYAVVDTWQLLIRDFTFALSGGSSRDLRFKWAYPRLEGLFPSDRSAALEEAGEKGRAINRFRVQRLASGNLRLDLASLFAELQIFSVRKDLKS